MNNKYFKEKLARYKETIRTAYKRNQKLEFQLELSLTEVEMNTKIIKIELNNKKRLVWLLIIVKIMIEMLANGISLLALAKYLELSIRIIYPNVIIKELLYADYVRKVRGIIRIILKTTAVCKLEKKTKSLQKVSMVY